MIENEIFSRWYQLVLLVVFGLQSLALGFYQFKKKTPFIISGRILSYLMVFLSLPVPLYWSIQGYLLHNSVVLGIFVFSLFSLLWLLFFSFFGDLVAFNVDEKAVRRAIESVCEDGSITCAEGLTTGLLAPGGKTKRRSIVTLYLNTKESNTPVRYVVAKSRNIASIKILKKQFYQSWPSFLKALEKELRSQPIASGKSYIYSVLIGCLLFLFAYFKFIPILR